MKNRSEIMANCPDGAEDFIKEVIDSIENRVTEIRDLLEINSLDKLDQICDAANLVTELCDDLY